MDWQNFSSELEVGITSYCQAECPLCDRTYRIHNLRLLHLNKKDFTDICTDLPNVIKTIRICGDYGDPLMNPHLDEILDYLVFEKKLNFRIHTNGAIGNKNGSPTVRSTVIIASLCSVLMVQRLK